MATLELDRPEIDRGEHLFFSLSPAPPFDLLKALTYLELRGLLVDPGDVEATRLHLTLPVGERTVRVALDSAGEPDAPTLRCRGVTDTGEPLDAAETDELRGTLRRALACDDEVRGFYTLAREDTPFWRLVEPLVGLHRVTFPTPFEAVAWFILKQREYTTVALARRRALTGRLGRALVVGANTYRAFPTPGDLLAAPFATVRDLVKKRRKAHYLRHAAEAFARQEPDFFGRAPVEEVEEWLLAVRGVGPWTARAFLGSGLNRPSLAHTVARDGSIGPYWREVFTRHYGAEVELGFLTELAEHYGAYQSYWLYYAGFMHRVMEQRAPR